MVPAGRRPPESRTIPRLDALLSRSSYSEIAYLIAAAARSLNIEVLVLEGIMPANLA